MANESSFNVVFKVAFAWNLFWGLPLLIVPGMAMTGIGLPEPAAGLGEFHARAAGLAVVLFGWIYLTVGRDLSVFRPFLRIAIAAKVLFFMLVVTAYRQHRELLPMLLIAIGDLAFGAFFFLAWQRTR